MLRYISIDRIIIVYDVTLYTYIGQYNIYVTLYYNYPERICMGRWYLLLALRDDDWF